jgi:hypothetical protein
MTTIINGSSPSITFSDGSAQTSATRPFLNRIINGAMVIDQRNAGASGTGNSNYTVDRWQYYGTQASKGTWQQNAGSVTPPVGFSKYLGFTSSSAYSVTSTDQFIITQYIEGFNTADLGFGTANAKTFTLSFWVYSSLTGTFGGSFQNGAQNRCYPFTYTVSSANTWTQISVTVAGDTTGTWVGATNGYGLAVNFSLGTGTTYSGTAGAWASATGLTSATGAVSVVGTNGATFYITGVQLEVGSTATSFDYRPYGTELALCYRYYYQRNIASGDYPFALQAYNTTSVYGAMVQFPVTMRATPTMASSGAFLAQQANSGSSNTLSTFGASLKSTSAFGCFSDGTSGFTGMVAGNMSTVYCNAASYISASAEL